jgi:hypothetical protein
MSRDSGQATVELALCLPFVALLIAAIVEVGILGSEHIRVWHATREAARVAAVENDHDEISRAAGSSGLEGLEIEISPGIAERRYGAPVTVAVRHRHHASVPLVGRLFEGVHLSAEATMRIEQP